MPDIPDILAVRGQRIRGHTLAQRQIDLDVTPRVERRHDRTTVEVSGRGHQLNVATEIQYGLDGVPSSREVCQTGLRERERRLVHDERPTSDDLACVDIDRRYRYCQASNPTDPKSGLRGVSAVNRDGRHDQPPVSRKNPVLGGYDNLKSQRSRRLCLEDRYEGDAQPDGPK